MLVIFGWLRKFTVLGLKLDTCDQCGQLCQHVVGRKTNWIHIFWIPFVFIGFQHGMICTSCQRWTGIPFGTVRAGMKSGIMPLDRARPTAAALLANATAADEPPAPLSVLDRFVVNPKRGPWDMYLKAWPVLVAVLIVVGMVSPQRSTGSSSSLMPSAPAHTCWVGSDGSLTGCTLSNGSIDGTRTSQQVTCYFTDAEYRTATSLSCD